jgi:hypothetical protein
VNTTENQIFSLQKGRAPFWQDKHAPVRVPALSSQPSPVGETARDTETSIRKHSTKRQTVQAAIDKGFTRHDNRLAALQARDTRDSAQTLYLLVQIVSLLLEVLGSLRRETLEPDAFDRIIHASEQHARQALTHPDPYLLELVRNLYFPDRGKEAPVA